jgi:16S rRNA (guanine527-N7)-methyltransferase
MDSRRIAALLQPFLTPAEPAHARPDAAFGPAEALALSDTQLDQISAYLDMLLLWNARMNLSSVRDAESIVARHFGESLFAARHLFPARQDRASRVRLIDVGSGAGFPGLPIKIWSSEVQLTLIESNQKKATFLREVIRRIGLKDGAVFSGRAESFSGQAEVVTLRAVERFETVLEVASHLASPGGRVALLISAAQVSRACELAGNVKWQPATSIPLSSNRVLMIGQKDPLTAPNRALP